MPGWQGPECPHLQGSPLRTPSNSTFLACLLPATGLLSTWWQNSVVEVEIKDFEDPGWGWGLSFGIYQLWDLRQVDLPV